MMLDKTKKKETPEKKGSTDQPSLVLQIVNRYLLWVLGLLVAIVLFVGYLFLLEGQFAGVQRAAKDSLPAKIHLRDSLRSIKAELDAAILDYDKIKTSKKEAIDRINLLLPRESKYGDLFTMLDDLAKLNGMQLMNLTIALSDDTRQVPKAPSAQEEDDVVRAGLVRSLTMHMNIEGGTYESFKKYLDTIERNVRLFDIKSISFSGNAFIPNIDGSLPTPAYEIELVTYYQP